MPWDKVHKYGVVEMDGDNITSLVEKPERDEAPSNLMLNGVYIFSKSIFDYIEQIEVNEKFGELFITDALVKLIENEGLL